ncbi:hypothetical protein [Streptomyces sp. RG80]
MTDVVTALIVSALLILVAATTRLVHRFDVRRNEGAMGSSRLRGSSE